MDAKNIVDAIDSSLTIIAFATIFLKFGNFKGDAMKRLEVLEQAKEKQEKELKSLECLFNDFQVENAKAMGEINTQLGVVNTKMDSVFKLLEKMDKKLDKEKGCA